MNNATKLITMHDRHHAELDALTDSFKEGWRVRFYHEGRKLVIRIWRPTRPFIDALYFGIDRETGIARFSHAGDYIRGGGYHHGPQALSVITKELNEWLANNNA